MMRLLVLALASLTLAGCAALDPYAQAPVAQRLQREDALGDCARLFRANDTLIDAAGTRDALAPRVAGFPYLRVDRALATLADAADAGPSLARQWYAALALLDDDSRRIELRNAGSDDSDDSAIVAPLVVCRRLFARADQEEAASLREAAQVPDDYSSAMRAWGLYPLTRYAFAAGIRRWQRETVDEFTAHGDGDPARSRRQRYIVGGPQHMLPTLRQLPELGLPVVSPSALASLVARHAPTLEIETAGDDDRPGALVWRREPRGLQVGVDVGEPVLYVRTGHTRLGGRWLLQLTYAVWFAARSRQQAVDLLAGRLDGLLWRVTLDADGTALVYDTIHPCGCYHLFLPTERMRARPQVKGIEEGLFVVQTLRSPAANERVVLRLAAATHYLQRAETEMEGNDDKAIVLSLRDDDQLRSLPLPDGGTRSAFTPDGLIAGSERLERFYFWPMGIASAGQMRQWGRHATAFVGRRHFDDPTLFDRYFEHPP